MTTTDRRAALYTAYEHAARIVERIEDAQLARPTPCAEFDVGALISHTVGAAQRAAAIGRGETPSGEEFPHVPLAQAAGQLREAGKGAEAGWSEDARLTELVRMPWGEEYTGATLVDLYLAELATHAWDLAAATGDLDRLDQFLAQPALAAAHSIVKPEYRNMIEPGSPFASEIEAPPDADDWARLAAFMGRDPRAPIG